MHLVPLTHDIYISHTLPYWTLVMTTGPDTRLLVLCATGVRRYYIKADLAVKQYMGLASFSGPALHLAYVL